MPPEDHISIMIMAKNELHTHFPPFHFINNKEVEKMSSSAVGIRACLRRKCNGEWRPMRDRWIPLIESRSMCIDLCTN